jgi:hypothetical protein
LPNIQLAEVGSYTDLMKDALRLYEYIIDLDIAGAKFIVKPNDGEPSEVKIFA